MKVDSHELKELVSGLSSASIRTQALLDHYWTEQVAEWSAALPSPSEDTVFAGSSLHAALASVTAPSRQVLRRFELSFRLRLTVMRGRRIGIYAQPLNLGWEKSFGSLEEGASHLSLTVEATPLTAAPWTTSHLPVDESPLRPVNL